MKLHKESKEVRKVRGGILAGEVLAVALAAWSCVKYAPWWAWAAGGRAGAAASLARAGRPADKPIVGPAEVTPRFRVLNADTVLRAYYAAGLSHPDKPGQQLAFGTRDGPRRRRHPRGGRPAATARA